MENLYGDADAILLVIGNGDDSDIEFENDENPDQNSYFEDNEDRENNQQEEEGNGTAHQEEVPPQRRPEFRWRIGNFPCIPTPDYVREEMLVIHFSYFNNNTIKRVLLY